MAQDLKLLGEDDMLTQKEALLVQLGLFTMALEIIEAKRKDYSGDVDPFANLRMSAFVGVEPWRGVMVRRMDKISRRIHVLEHGGVAQVANESIMDALVDEMNYLAIEAGLLVEEEQGGALTGLIEAARRLPGIVERILGPIDTSVTRMQSVRD